MSRHCPPIGQLTYVKDGAREYSSFAYDNPWLASPDRFEVSPDLPLVAGHLVRRATTALRLAQRAGIDTSHARIVQIGDVAVAVIRRFDRTNDNARIP